MRESGLVEWVAMGWWGGGEGGKCEVLGVFSFFGLMGFSEWWKRNALLLFFFGAFGGSWVLLYWGWVNSSFLAGRVGGK